MGDEIKEMGKEMLRDTIKLGVGLATTIILGDKINKKVDEMDSKYNKKKFRFPFSKKTSTSKTTKKRKK